MRDRRYWSPTNIVGGSFGTSCWELGTPRAPAHLRFCLARIWFQHHQLWALVVCSNVFRYFSKGASSHEPSYNLPFTKKVGVPATPLRRPPATSLWTRSRGWPEAIIAATRSWSTPVSSTYRRRS